MFRPSPLQNTRYSFLEVPKPRVAGHGFETAVHFVLPNQFGTPLYKMILEYPLVKLMKDIGGEAPKDVGIW